jgi:hypothetical protein
VAACAALKSGDCLDFIRVQGRVRVESLSRVAFLFIEENFLYLHGELYFVRGCLYLKITRCTKRLFLRVKRGRGRISILGST